ncbi:origin recognition complex subunit 4 [Phanerochaete sordida]|uniref:Origin recognition complex subunit 4 n=1 Tax=Phanerochaete sordida TaxID=48140 RepID=A0A9P3L8C0_9APHY|nr:origin recognition complex subunit 4 [Phanerochaete sordida]
MFLDAVEVPTPSKKMRDIINIARSPRTVSPGKAVASPNKRLPPRDITPTRTLPQTNRKPPSRRVARPRSPSPEVELLDNPVSEPQSPTTPLDSTPAEPSPVDGEVAALPTSLGHQLSTLPSELEPCLEAQKRATLRALHEISALPQAPAGSDDAEVQPPTNALAYEQLQNLLNGTVERGEGNSCLVVGPKGSGKTQLVERAISSLSEHPIVIRLSGYAQTNDRLAIREIAWQLTEQTGRSLLPADNDGVAEDEDENPFLDKDNKPATDSAITLPPPSHLLALIAMLPTLARPTVIVLDAFDLFALHARQSLLYCLLDTVQSCRAVAGRKGIAVVGLTMRVETINILEKRVKSRFSGRIIRTAGHPTFDSWAKAAKDALCAPADVDQAGWHDRWTNAVANFLGQEQVLDSLRETYSLTRDIRVLSRLLVAIVTSLKPSSPYPSASEFAAAVAKQRAPPRFSFLTSLTYPAVCLLIAAMHARTSGHEAFTFEMLHEAFREQVRVSLSAPVTVEGGGIGMVRCSREVLFGAFEKLVALTVFVATGPTAVGIGREFIKYRCDIDRTEAKNAVESFGQLNLRKWLNKAN